MSRPPLLTEAEIADGLTDLADWSRNGDALVGAFRFPSFRDAMAFMARVAVHAERLDHHPDWSNSYRDVRMRLTTHRAANGRGVTALDLTLARLASEAAGE